MEFAEEFDSLRTVTSGDERLGQSPRLTEAVRRVPEDLRPLGRATELPGQIDAAHVQQPTEKVAKAMQFVEDDFTLFFRGSISFPRAHEIA